MDASNMEQIVMNLVVNARDAMPRGGRLSISGTRATLDADEPQLGLPAGNYVEIVVSDTGVGMAEDVKEKVFEPFFTTKDVGKGTGLGLATVHGIVNAVGGEITVESEPGRGTTFIIYLPISQRGTRRDAVPSVQLPRPRDLTVLLVDDEPTVRRAVRRLMERAGHRVLESRSPSDAIAIAATHAAEIDVLLTDVVMPEMSGFQLASELREVHPSLRVVLMSGHSDDLIAHHAELDRGVSMLRKPFSPEELNRKLFEVLE
jgi:CheY-like chemotaxis protein